MGGARKLTGITGRLFVALAVMLGFASCSSSPIPTMPDVVGKKLDVAKSDIERANIKADVEVVGGGVFGVLNDHNWEVCDQLPAAGAQVSEKPRLTVERSCADASPSPSASERPTASASQSSAPQASPAITAKVKDITVDKLADRVNSNKVKTGDLFRVTGELTGAEFWTTGASGDYFVYLETQKGSDLIVFVDESETDGWQDGMRVEMVLEAVRVTIDGETTDGWMRARSTHLKD